MDEKNEVRIDVKESKVKSGVKGEVKNNQGNWVDFMQMVEKIMIEKYGETLVDHAHNPRNYGRMEDANIHVAHSGKGHDTVEIWLKVVNDTIEKISFKLNGCEMTKAATSMVTELAKGKKLADALQITPIQVRDALGRLPENHDHCAYLAVDALHEAIKSAQDL